MSALPAKQKSPGESRVIAKTPGDLKAFLDKHKAYIEQAVPKYLTPERIIQVAMIAHSRNQLLQKCDLRTLFGAIIQAALMGLECDGISGESYLIPYWNSKVNGYECQLQPGYQGIVKLARNSGQFSIIDAQPVREKDEFDFMKGSDVWWTHKWPHKGDRGNPYGYWAGYVLKDGGKNFEYWTVESIEAHRDRYSQGAYKKERGQFVLDQSGEKMLQGPWRDSPDWMYRKTPLKQVLKLAPKSYEMHLAQTFDERIEAGLRQPFSIEVPLELQPPPEDDDSTETITVNTQSEPLKEPQQTKPVDTAESKPADPPKVDKARADLLDKFEKLFVNLGEKEFLKRLTANGYTAMDEILTAKMPTVLAEMEKM
jgi:recombination protein RecT